MTGFSTELIESDVDESFAFNEELIQDEQVDEVRGVCLELAKGWIDFLTDSNTTIVSVVRRSVELLTLVDDLNRG